MTSSLRRKRQTTVPARNTPSWTAYSLACLLALAGMSSAQSPTPSTRPVSDVAPINVPPPSPPLSSRSSASGTKTTTLSPAPLNIPGKLVSTPLVPAAQPVTRTMYYQKPAEPKGNSIQRVGQVEPKVAPVPKEGAETRTTLDDLLRYQIRLEPPGPELVFRLESEAALEQRMRQEAKQQNLTEAVVFPPLPVLSKVEFQGRTFPQQVVYAEPRYVNYRRLLFEEKNA